MFQEAWLNCPSIICWQSSQQVVRQNQPRTMRETPGVEFTAKSMVTKILNQKQNTKCTYHHPSTIYENYRVITLILKKYGNLPLCLETYALFSLPPIFTTILYSYPLRYILYLGEPLGNIISNFHGKFIHLCMY